MPLAAGPIDLEPSATSGLPVTLSAAGGCKLVERDRVALRALGTCTVTASQPGDDRWHPAPPVTVTTEVVPPLDGEGPPGVATVLPPTFLAPGAVVHAILDPNRGPAHYYGIWLQGGATVHPEAVAGDRAVAVSIAEAPDTWTTDPDLVSWSDVPDGRWFAPSDGLYLLRVADESGPGSPYRYTLAVGVDAAPPLSSLPPDGAPLTGSVELGSRVAAEPPGTAVAPGAVVGAYLTVDRPTGYFRIQLAPGDTLDVRAHGQVTLALAYPSAPETWYPLGGSWLATESGAYTVRVTAFPLSGGVPFTASFDVEPAP
jgi:hypothetical protein